MSAHSRYGPSPYRRAICPVCKRDVAVYTPSKGDGTVDIYRAHNLPNTLVRCDGRARDVKPDAYVDSEVQP